ncbi:hypothetical protein BJ944DRAFT_245600 [Cunninghamella echinulata]|nr:hypothetical protein BJ944DRAFT_245600 [Cunninghamella echinulata]
MTSFDALSPQKDFLPLIDKKKETALSLSDSVTSANSYIPRKRQYSQTKSNIPTISVDKRGSKSSNYLIKTCNNNNININSSKVVKKMDDIPYGLSDDDDDDDFTNSNNNINSNSAQVKDQNIIHDQLTLTAPQKNIQSLSIKNSPDTKALSSSLVTDDDFSLITISPIPPTSSPFNQLSQMDDCGSSNNNNNNNNNNNTSKRSSPFSQFDMLPTQLYEPTENVTEVNAPTQLYNVYDIPTQPYDPNTNINADYDIPTQPYDVNDHLADDCPTQIYSPNENKSNNNNRDLPTQLYNPNDDIAPTQIYDPYGNSIPTTQLVDIYNDEYEDNEDFFLLENIHSTDINKANLNIHNKHHNIPNNNKNSNDNIHISTQDYNDYGVGYERDILDDDSEDEINNISITKTYRNYLLPMKKLPMKNNNIRKNHHNEDSDLDFPLLGFDSDHDITAENKNNDKGDNNGNISPEKGNTSLSSSSTSLPILNNNILQEQQQQKNIIKTNTSNNVYNNDKKNKIQSSLEEFYSYLSSGSSISTAKSPSSSSSSSSSSSPPFPSLSSPLKKNMSLSQQSSISSSSPLKKLSLTKNTKRTTYSSNDPLWMSSLSSSPLEEKSKKDHVSLQPQKEQKLNKIEKEEESKEAEKEEEKKEDAHHNIKQPSLSTLSSITTTTNNNNNNNPKRIRFPRLGISKRSPISLIHKHTPNLDPTHTIIPYHKSTPIAPLTSSLSTPSVSRKTLGMKKRNRNPLK